MASTIAGPKDALNPTLEEAAATVATLVQDFSANDKYYLSSSYQEAAVRDDFIDKFLFALGWDVTHTIQKNPFQQEVKVERNVQMATAQRRADYALSLDPNFDSPVLYVEAKKPADDIATRDNYFQIIRYANQRGHDLGILTNFNQLHIIDCRFQAKIDTAIYRVLKKYHYSDFVIPEKFAEIFFLFSRPAITGGSLQKYAEKLAKRKGRPGQKAFLPLAYKPIDERLLETLDVLRSTLARALKNSNPKLDSAALTELTQRIIDRLVLIRFLEDKLIEPDPIIPSLGESTDRSAWQDFRAVCRKLDKTYNGIVYKFHPTLDAPDGLSIDDKNFDDVLNAFDYHKSEYLFNDIPLHILGSIYERFLGNVIVATKKRATLEPKPEVRKAGGVYYTPKYIVDYIVQNTVGKLIDGKSPGEISKMRFADIACGSGSFLLGVYDCLLKYITHWYNEHPSKAPKPAVMKRNNALYLSLQEKARILTDNIYGVDIDSQAVEVAQLSLYLKLLEEETTASARQYTLDFHRPLLPSLADNIKCGNSLIDSEFYNDNVGLFDDKELRTKVNTFDWKPEFPNIFKDGGFNAIVGNPPYVNAWELYASVPEIRDYINADSTYTTADRHWDLYVVFIERALSLLKESGSLAYIIPYSYAIQKYGINSRRMVLDNCTLESVADLRTVRVFGTVPVITIIPIIKKEKPKARWNVQIRKPGPTATKLHAGTIEDVHVIPQSLFRGLHECMLRLDLNSGVQALCDKIDLLSVRVGDLCYVNYGAQMSSKEKGRFGKDFVLRSSAASATCRKTISGRNLYRYRATWDGSYVEWKLADQMYGSREARFFETPKLMIRDITGTHRLELTYDESKLYCDHTRVSATLS
ncbi:MAG: N-6 DNA methylase [Planctomycetota bacterium]